MAVSVTLPALGESVTEGTVTRWLKAEGERVEADEPLLEVSTDKVDTEIPAPAAGVLASIKVAEDETVEVGAELAVIDDGTRRARRRPGPGRRRGPAPAAEPAAAPAPAAEAPAAPARRRPRRRPPPAGGAAGHRRRPARARRERHRGHRHPLAQGGRREVEADEPLLEVSTDKVDTEIPAPASGVLLEIVVGEDETAEVGAKLAVIGAAGCRSGRRPGSGRPGSGPGARRPGPALRPRPRRSGPGSGRARRSGRPPLRPLRLRPGPGCRAAPAPRRPGPGRSGRRPPVTTAPT